jgi:hypothetical protein
MYALKERIEGQGELESWERPVERFPVRFAFEITTDILERPGFPRVAAQKHGIGTVKLLAGKSVGDGYYRLHAADGEILKVQNVGFCWVILDW